MVQQEKVQNFLNILVDSTLTNIRRAAGTVNITFTISESTTIELHIQCLFRVMSREKDQIEFTSVDRYYPSSKLLNQNDFNWANFTWDIQGRNMFDEKKEQWINLFKEKISLLEVKMNHWGDLRIYLSTGDIFEIYIDKSENECWRLFSSDVSQNHLVVFGDGYSWEDEQKSKFSELS